MRLRACVALAVAIAAPPAVEQTADEAAIVVALYASRHRGDVLREELARLAVGHLAALADREERLARSDALPARRAIESRYEAERAKLLHRIAVAASEQSGLLLKYAESLKARGRPIPVPDDHGPEE